METDLSIWLTSGRALGLFAAFIGFAWALRRMRRESAEQLERVTDELRRARAETHVLSERVAALATLVAAIPARVEQRPVEAPRAPRLPAASRGARRRPRGTPRARLAARLWPSDRTP